MTTARSKNRLARFRELNPADRWLLLRAVAWLAVARLMLVVMPFQRLSERLAAKGRASDVSPDRDFLRRVTLAVSAAARHVPWRSDCFPQAIAARVLLSRQGYPSTIHLGVEKTDPSTVAGHAWLTCAGEVITGGDQADRYVEIHRLGE